MTAVWAANAKRELRAAHTTLALSTVRYSAGTVTRNETVH